MKKLNPQTVTKAQLAKALMFTGKFIIDYDFNLADTKLVRQHVEDFIQKLEGRKDLFVTNNCDMDSAYNLADKSLRYNSVIVGRGLFTCGYNLLHAKTASKSHNQTFILLQCNSNVTFVSPQTHKKIIADVKAGKDYHSIMDSISDKVLSKIDANTSDYNPDLDENAEAEETTKMDDATDELMASCNFADKFGKTKQGKNKLFLQGVFEYQK